MFILKQHGFTEAEIEEMTEHELLTYLSIVHGKPVAEKKIISTRRKSKSV